MCPMQISCGIINHTEHDQSFLNGNWNESINEIHSVWCIIHELQNFNESVEICGTCKTLQNSTSLHMMYRAIILFLLVECQKCESRTNTPRSLHFSNANHAVVHKITRYDGTRWSN